MPHYDYQLAIELLLTLAASFLIGLEMEERKAGGKLFAPGGVRTFPLIALAAFLLTKFAGGPGAPFVAGLLVVGLWMGLLYRAKMAAANYGMTTEAYALVTYVLGGVAATGQWWVVGVVTVLMIVIQELKAPLEKLAVRLPQNELVTIAKFLLLIAVILPLMPNHDYTQFQLNPRKIWLIVVAVAAVSYAGYILQRVTGRTDRGLLLTGLLGGAYSSTATTISLSRQARSGQVALPGRAIGGAILSASGVMNLRLLALIAVFDQTADSALTYRVLWPLLCAAAMGIGVGAVLSLGRQADPSDKPAATPKAKTSPLEIRTAIVFAAVFVVIMVLTRLVSQKAGSAGVLVLAGVSGLVDIDPFVLSLTQGVQLATGTAAVGVLIAAGANNLAKGAYAAVVARARGGFWALGLLVLLAAVTVASGWILGAGR